MQENTQPNQPVNESLSVPPPPSLGEEDFRNVRDFKPKILVVGVGGAGCNAVNNMIRSQLEGVEFVVMNTDAQALLQSLADRRVHLGEKLTQGLGAGSSPEIGRQAAEESYEQIAKEIRGSHMVFIAVGEGGGTGTGAAPVVARIARELGILVVAIATKPFNFEGVQRMRVANAGLIELAKNVDTIIELPNQNLFRVANASTTLADAFKQADNVLYAGVRSITDLMIKPGLINLDFADVRTVMKEMGRAMMGTGEATGEGRAIAAAEAAIANPLLEDVTIENATGLLISIIGGMDMTLFEVDEAANRIREQVKGEANIIFGSSFDDGMDGVVRVSVVATGIEAATQKRVVEEKVTSSSQVRREGGGNLASQSQDQMSSSSQSQEGQGSAFPEGGSLFPEEEGAPERKKGHPTLNLDGFEVSEAVALPDHQRGDDYVEANDEDLPVPSGRRSVSPREALEEDLFAQPQEKSQSEENAQLEIRFGKPSSVPPLPKGPAKETLSSGNFLSRFLRGRSKVQESPPQKGFPSKPSVDLRIQERPSQDFEDDLDVPTFMRKQGKGR